MKYDDLSRGFLLKKSNRNGILEVNYKGVTSLFDLSKSYNYSPARKFESRFLTGTPLKYLWVPVKFLVTAPVITVRDLIDGRAYSIGSDLGYFWVRNGFFGKNYNEDQKKGYFVFNKPRYMPGDTVKFKAFLVRRNGKPVNRELDLKIRKNRGNDINLFRINPLNPGNYNGQFVLADSLDLDLDNYYSLCLNKSKVKTYSSGTFKYEDYELKNISLTVRPDSSVHIRGREFIIHIRATDENNLNIQDGRIELTLKSNNITRQFDLIQFLFNSLFTIVDIYAVSTYDKLSPLTFFTFNFAR